jgi:hypothetical protein
MVYASHKILLFVVSSLSDIALFINRTFDPEGKRRLFSLQFDLSISNIVGDASMAIILAFG